MLPLARAGKDEAKTVNGHRIGGELVVNSEDEDKQINLIDGMSIKIQRWNSAAWLTTEKKTVHVWRFDPDGLCEPVSIRLLLNKSWFEDTYHPLTASIRESKFETR